MSQATPIQVPQSFLGTEIPLDLRESLTRHILFLDEDDARSLVAAAVASWVITSSTRREALESRTS
jgi:hypothetical protein